MVATRPAVVQMEWWAQVGTCRLVICLLILGNVSCQDPIFVSQRFTIDEGQPPGTYIGQIGSSVPNISPPIQFVAPTPQIGENIRLESSGKLYTRKKLDRETTADYNFFTQDKLFKFIKIEISINDINDNTPYFSNKTKTLYISELAPEGNKFSLGKATDLDSGSNGIEDCRIISGNKDNHFTLISRQSGSIDWLLDLVLSKQLDYEEKTQYQLVVQARDGGTPRRSANLNVLILVSDQNDNQPQFVHSRYNAQVAENATIGTSILQVSATDNDSGENGRVTYLLDPMSEQAKYFQIDPVTGIVRVNKYLDYETLPRFSITVFAQDNGPDTNTAASASLEIDLLNINELPANISLVFLHSSGNKTGRISEDVQPGTHVALISISDPDSPKAYFNASVTLLGDDGVFGLKESNGVVYLIVISTPPDREVKPFYNLTIIATDSGNPPLRASYSFTIWIDDVNDNDPVFSQQVYFAEVNELSEPGTSITIVVARDPDVGNNARILYSISDRTPTSWFKINRNSGLITTKSAIDCEIEAQPKLIIIASDGGKPPRISSATVVITVKDVNDNQPEFDQSFYSASVPEDKDIGKCILQVTAVDPECGKNVGVTYSMDGAAYPDVFSVDSQSGHLCIAKPLDHETNPSYNFMVKASDSEGLSTSTLVRVTVQDVNDNRPVFEPSTYSRNYKEGLALQMLLTVHAQDDDDGTYGTVKYSIISGNDQAFFTIDPSNGAISLVKLLPDGPRTYPLRVQATDGGGLQASTAANVTISIAGPDSVPPSFSYTLYNYTITEGVGGGTEVGRVAAISEDPSSPRVKYRILSGGNGWFAIGATSGRITSVGDIDRESRTSLLLSVEAEAGNPPIFAIAQVNITILDVNDNTPTFVVSNNYLEINEREDRATTSDIYVVQAVDGDEDRNGTIQYSLRSNPGRLFHIDPLSGVIRLQGQLDYEKQQKYELHIVATDKGVPVHLSSTMTLVVNVKDVNDNPPKFARAVYNFNVRENINLTTSFAQIRATDADSAENGRVYYMFEDSRFSSVFGINPPNGNLYVKEPLDREERDLYILTVIASDHGKMARKTATAQVRIHITDENDNFPVFSSAMYHFTIQENLRIGSAVGQVVATDEDINENGNLQYRFLHDSVPQKFVINPHNGEISTNKELDREDENRADLIVVVSDGATNAKTSTVAVKIDIMDINDNPPEFKRDELYTATVQENKPKGTKVLRVIATDQDDGLNGTVSYSLKNAPGESTAILNFDIHPSSGLITTKEVLDFEAKKQYKLEVVARDNGQPALEMRQTVIITVGDDKYEAPLFHAKNISFEVVENTKIGTVVGTVTSHDYDSGENGRIAYYIISGNVFSLFTVNHNTGEISSIRDIDYEESSSHTLGIRAVDNHVLFPKSSNISVTIRVIDVNDNAPIFEQDPIVLRTIKENIATGHAVYTFTATDKDSGLNGTVRYDIVSESHSGPDPDGGKYFMIDSNSGQLKVRRNIDYERVHQISLIVVAQDRCDVGSCNLNATVTTNVYVIDVNDNYPVFESPTTVHIFEDEDIYYSIMNVMATDQDSNDNNSGNNLLTYNILSGNVEEKFDLDGMTGLLTIANPLDREERNSYALNISAEDHGSPKRISHKIFNLIIQDVNDKAPHFSNATYYASIPEHANGNTTVVTVHATDDDIGANAQLTYMIPTGIANNRFSINSATGEVKATVPLDREQRSSFIVAVYVRDGGYPALYDQATIMVSVLDINDNSPVFKSQSYTINIPENSRQSAIFAFTAYDADTGRNAQVTYTIVDGNGDGKFMLDPITAELSCKPLDREDKATYRLTIKATDRGAEPRSATTAAVITVLDENDNSPRFAKPLYRAGLREDVRRGEHVLRVVASDNDSGHNGDVTYSLGNDTEGLFSVNATSGEIITTGLFDREKKGAYFFDIIAMDGGVSGPRNSTAKIEIIISDVNDNAPVFVKVPYRKRVGSQTSAGVNILTVSAQDPDAGQNSMLEYIMDQASGSGRWFRMTGATIVTTRSLSDAVGYHNIQIIVMDKGNPALSSTGVVEITVGSPGSPTLAFLHDDYNTEIPEDARNGAQVLQVQARYNSNTITYRFAGGNEGNPFYIDLNSGVISVRKTELIDYEASKQMRLIVQASSLNTHAYATVWVNLTDVNDNTPKFTQQRYYTSIWENNAPETFLIEIHANDPDSGRNGHVRYNIIKGNTDNAFDIYPGTGIVMTTRKKSQLDREITPSYELLIEAVDQGSPSRSSRCTLSITINDKNDNEPNFPKHPIIKISENRKVGSHITSVTATDVDFQPKLLYSFQTNGNMDGTFNIDRFSGSISLATPVDYEDKNRYVLGIAVSDDKHNKFTQIDIHIEDENDNAPEFSQQNYQVALDESTPPDTPVITVNATDRDSGENKRITYSLRSTFNNSFFVNPQTGAIYTKVTLTYDVFSSIVELVVVAQDHGSPSLSDMVAVHVQITDINKFSPEFNKSSYEVSISEFMVRGERVLQVSAIDRDIVHTTRDDNINYKLIGDGATNFQIRGKTGEVILMNQVNREMNISQFHLTAIATDRGNPPLSARVPVTITILDENDNPPRFHQPDNIYHIELAENYPSEQVFQLVTADDADEGLHAKIQYTITSGNNEGIFFIHGTNGGLFVMPGAHLDYESHTFHRLIVRAVDCSKCPPHKPRLSAFVTVEINVTDVNEFSPVFPVSPYMTYVKENREVGSLVFQAQANDGDGGKYGILTYAMLPNSTDYDYFKLNSTTGLVTTRQMFNYETRDYYSIKVAVSDIDHNMNAINVMIKIVDVDEYEPKFTQESYKFQVKGSDREGAYVGRVVATDNDGGTAGKVVYEIEYLSDYFAIHPATGNITVKRSFHSDAPRPQRRKRALSDKSTTLMIRAWSGQDNSRETTARVVVDIDRECEGCVYIPAAVTGGVSPVGIAMIVVMTVIIIIAVVIIVICLVRRRRRKNKRPPHDPNDNPDSSGFNFTPPALMRPPVNGAPPPYKDHMLSLAPNAANVTSSDISEQSHSASSGRGSAEEEDEDEEIRMINSNNHINNAQNYMHRKHMPDSGIPPDDDTLSEPSVQTHQEYLARLGIDSAKIGKPKPKAHQIAQSVESMHQFSDEGGGEGNMEAHSDYDKMTDMETDEEVAMIDRNKDMGFHEPEAQHAGSLSSVINSEEEYSGSYNWDYLLNWGPQYQPLAHVFAEIAKLKDDSVQPRKHPVRTVPQRLINTSLSPPKVKTVPPPMITNAPPKAFAPRPSHTSSGSSSHANSARASTMNTSLPSLPRSPISYESSVTSPALTPSFTPSLSPLATGSPSPVVSAHGSGHSSGHTTPGKGISKRNGHIVLSASSESEQEFRI